MEDGKEYTYREPTQKPINPPYKAALEKKRGKGNATNAEDEDDTTGVEEDISNLSLDTSLTDNDSTLETNLMGNEDKISVPTLEFK